MNTNREKKNNSLYNATLEYTTHALYTEARPKKCGRGLAELS